MSIYENFIRMLPKEKDLDVAIVQMQMDATHLEMDVKTVGRNIAKDH